MNRLRNALISGLVMGTLFGCGPSEEELGNLIDERAAVINERNLVEHGLIKSEEERQVAAAAEAAKPAWVKSMDLLAEFDELMADYRPVLPDEVDNTDMLRCTTAFELGEDKELKSGARSLVKQAEASQKEREKKRRDFEKNKWIQYRTDHQWEQRIGTVPVKDCWFNYDNCWRGCVGYRTCDSWTASCDYGGMKRCYEQYDNGKGQFWEQYVPKIRYYGEEGALSYRYAEEGTARYSRTASPTEPELMKRIASSGLVVPERFTCKVEEARKVKEHVMVQCAGDKPRLTQIRVNGDLPQMVHKGDIVSVPVAKATAFASVHGTILKEEIRMNRSKVRVWLVDADGASLTFDEHAVCPTKDEVLEAATLTK